MQPDAPPDPALAAPAVSSAATPPVSAKAKTGAALMPDRPSLRAKRELRRTRAAELARLLPLLGMVLFFLPVLGNNARASGSTGIWLFACWAGLIVVAGWLAPGLQRDLDPDGDGRQDGR